MVTYKLDFGSVHLLSSYALLIATDHYTKVMPFISGDTGQVEPEPPEPPKPNELEVPKPKVTKPRTTIQAALSKWKPPKYTISDAFRMFCKRTNGHGWFRIIRAPTMRGTCFWFTLTFVFFAVGIIYTIALWTRFVTHDTETSISASIGNLPFPAVTVCSNNPLKRSKIDDAKPAEYRDKLEKIPFNIKRLLNETIYYTDKLQAEALDLRFEAFRNMILARDDTSLEQRKDLGYSADEIVKFCSFGGKICNFKAESVQVFDDAFGNCYTWNPSNSDLVVQAGIQHGLHLILNIAVADYLPWYTESEGAKIVLHEPGTMPLPLIDGKSVAAGYETEFSVSLRKYDRLPEPYNDPGCTDDYNNFKQLFSYEYTSKACRKTCKQLAIIKECGCSDFRLPQTNNEKLCDMEQRSVISCVTDAVYKFETNPDQHCFCPPACKEKEYHSMSSFSVWPAPKFESTFKYSYGFEHQNTASIKIYYGSPIITEFKDIPSQTTYQFLGWMGGQLYAWTGTSVITIIEFLLFVSTAALVLFTENIDWLMAQNDDGPLYWFYF